MCGWYKGRVTRTCLLLALLALLLGLGEASRAKSAVRSSVYAAQVKAAQLMKESLESVRRLRAHLSIPVRRDLDPNVTGIIGEELTPLTTSLGVLEAKRTATNPAFAALMVRLFKDAGLAEGDAVAVGASGSFPSLILATLSAAKTLELKPVVIYSAGASMYGANIPGFTFLDMLTWLNEEGILPYRPAAVSLGGEGDRGLGVVTGEGSAMLRAAVQRSGVTVIAEPTVAESIRRRLEIYAAQAGNRPVRCFVNIGGADPNYGQTSASLDFPNGLVRRGPVLSSHPGRGLVFEYAARGVSVINLLDVRGLALKYGIPVDPVPLPPIGAGGVYASTLYPRAPIVLGLIGAAAILGAGAMISRNGT